jgi:plasmid stabilization system protein ParE
MNCNSKLLRQVKNDIREAAKYYNQQQKGLGLRFLKEVNSRVATIGKQPKSFQIRYREVRIALLKKFPYTIHYLLDEESKQIIILAVFHHDKDSAKWIQE